MTIANLDLCRNTNKEGNSNEENATGDAVTAGTSLTLRSAGLDKNSSDIIGDGVGKAATIGVTTGENLLSGGNRQQFRGILSRY